MLMNNLLRFEHKKIRANVIKEYIGADKPVICFSCGNASRELKLAGLNVLDISPSGDLLALRWFTINEIKQKFPGYFDATSGHLDITLMGLIGKAYKERLGELLSSPCYVPCGSGETLVCLKLAYPEVEFIAVYNLDSATEYSENAPLNDLVKVLAKDVIYGDYKSETSI